MRIFLVYAGSPDNNLNYSPYSITRNLYKLFVDKGFEVKYYDWFSRGPFEEPQENDIIIGHPNYPADTATRVLFQSKAKRKFLIFPLHTYFTHVNWLFNDLVEQAAAVFSITGKYWYDTLESTCFAPWKSKIVRLDMAVDQAAYPFVKEKYSPSGYRDFVYLGSDIAEKNIGMLTEMFKRVPYKLHAYGSIDGANLLASLPNVTLYGWSETNHLWARALADKADCFLNTSISDANPTSLIEAASWGFQIACTKESGYWPNDPFHSLNLEDINGSVDFLHWLNKADENDLLTRALEVRKLIGEKHNWKVFIDRVWEGVSKFIG